MGTSRRVAGAAFVAAAVALAGGTVYANTHSAAPLVTSHNEMLSAIWQKYTASFINADGRVIDKADHNLTTSEGQSYAMLRAVWQDDRATFDRVWKFTKDSLKRPNDRLFAWKFGQLANGSYGVLVDQGGQNTASDADTDIALALTMAYGRWQESHYLQDAQPIMSDIWANEVVQVAGRPVLASNNLERTSTSPDVIVNPSYFAPYAYRIFARVDKGHDWSSLVTSSYDVIDRVLSAPLDRGTSAGLPPNWVRINRQTGDLSPVGGDKSTDFGYDALRLPWRLAVDAQWNAEPRASASLARLHFLADQWRQQGKIVATFAHDGSNPAAYESPSMYGGSLGYFHVADPATATTIYDTKLVSLYDTDKQAWRAPLSYYDDNWAWFGMALQLGALPNLAEGVK